MRNLWFRELNMGHLHTFHIGHFSHEQIII